MTDYDEDAFVEDMDFLGRQGLDRPQMAVRMGCTEVCLEGRIRRAVRAGKVEKYVSPLRPCGVRPTRSWLLRRLAVSA